MLDIATRIGILAPIAWSIPPKKYGPWEKVTYNLIKGLHKLGYQNITLFATQETSLPGVKTMGLLKQPLAESGMEAPGTWEWLHLAHACAHAGEVDILHSHCNWKALLFSDFIRTPLVTTLHGSGIEAASAIGYRQYKHQPFVSISNAERRFVPELNYVSTVYNGIDFDEFSFGDQAEDYLVNIGRMHPEKGVHHAIALAQKLDMPLYIAGLIQEEWRDYFDNEVKPHVDDKLIHFLGNLSSAEVHTLVARARAYIGMIEWEEPFGLSIAEAMASGTPVIATPRGAHEEIIIEGQSGILVNTVQEAVKRFPEVLKIDRQLCRQTAYSIFGLEKMAADYAKAYEKILTTG